MQIDLYLVYMCLGRCEHLLLLAFAVTYMYVSSLYALILVMVVVTMLCPPKE